MLVYFQEEIPASACEAEPSFVSVADPDHT